eukprot:gnl/TRDRNA2_/TRDRNA2_166162_c1_seq2.p1 gnl/TRDRNA2_/TRDRNA2_166162_c1~~gnl/TRDRNA2_/TRDRNA2_166162_c1_seq2.p1  ORF type:complete len:234 (+),score=39.32 gnl/TRDRNA2_/TRDRNA2_166162_c1_seq2:2-703(+)
MSFEEFADNVLRLCGSKHALHSLFVQHDICDCRQVLEECIDTLAFQVSALNSHTLASSVSTFSEGIKGHDPTVSAAPSPSAVAVHEEAVSQLLARMDRFAEVDRQILSELRSLGASGAVLPQKSLESYSLAPPHVLSSGLGKELLPCSRRALDLLRFETDVRIEPELRDAHNGVGVQLPICTPASFSLVGQTTASNQVDELFCKRRPPEHLPAGENPPVERRLEHEFGKLQAV